MINSFRNWKGYRNEITDVLDEYLIKCDGCTDLYYNYIYEKPVNGNWAIRVPGATRGHINIENGVIKEIELYKDSFCYTKDVYDNLSQFIGLEIDLGR